MRKNKSTPINTLLKKVTTPQVIPSGTGYTVSTKSSKNIGTLLLRNIPNKMQDVYSVAITETKTVINFTLAFFPPIQSCQEY